MNSSRIAKKTTSKIELSEEQCTPVFSELIWIVNFIFSTKIDNLNKITSTLTLTKQAVPTFQYVFLTLKILLKISTQVIVNHHHDLLTQNEYHGRYNSSWLNLVHTICQSLMFLSKCLLNG